MWFAVWNNDIKIWASQFKKSTCFVDVCCCFEYVIIFARLYSIFRYGWSNNGRFILCKQSLLNILIRMQQNCLIRYKMQAWKKKIVTKQTCCDWGKNAKQNIWRNWCDSRNFSVQSHDILGKLVIIIFFENLSDYPLGHR